jgi:hypothetical protein
MQFHSKSGRRELLPMAVAAAIALSGSLTLFLMDFGPNNDVQRGGLSMITAAVVDRAGATASPTQPTVQPVSLVR